MKRKNFLREMFSMDDLDEDYEDYEAEDAEEADSEELQAFAAVWHGDDQILAWDEEGAEYGDEEYLPMVTYLEVEDAEPA